MALEAAIACGAAKDVAALTKEELDAMSESSTEAASDPSDLEQTDAGCRNGVLGASFAQETLIFVDWDDTLLPTSWLQRQHLLMDSHAPLNEEQSLQCDRMAESAARMLQAAMQLGRVVIVTNSLHGWVEASCWKLMSSLAPVLAQVRIVSARSSFQEGARSPEEWKRRAFAREVHAFYGRKGAGQRRNIISLGDSMHERWALVSVTRGVPNCLCKSLKFMERPGVEQLVGELELARGSLRQIADEDADLDFELWRD